MFRLTESRNLKDPRFLGLYRSSFPPDEQIPPSELSNLLGKGGKLLLATDSDVFVGFAFVFENKGALYIAYLAVTPSLRGEGYGSDILESIVNDGNHSGYILSIECADYDDPSGTRTARRRFYEKNGWRRSSLRILTKRIDLDIYTIDSNLSDDEILDTIRSFYGNMS